MDTQIDNRQKILDKALELFCEKGFDAVGVQLLCEESGITKPTLYYYFGSKEGLFKEVLNFNYEKLNALISKASIYIPNVEKYEEDVYPVLNKVARSYFDFAKNNSKFYRLILSSLYAPPTSKTYETVVGLNDRQYEIIEKMFFEFSRFHHNMKGKEKRFSSSFVGIINVYVGMWYSKSEYLGAETAEDLVSQFMHGIFS